MFGTSSEQYHPLHGREVYYTCSVPILESPLSEVPLYMCACMQSNRSD